MESLGSTILPVLISGAIITGLFGLLGVILTRSVQAAQLKVQEQTLFTALLPRRIEWLDAFRKAVNKWDKQMMKIIHHVGPALPRNPTALFEVERLAGEAQWLFGGDVAHHARKIVEQLEVVKNLRINAVQGMPQSHQNAQLVGPAVTCLYDQFEPLGDAMKPFLFVGDIKNSTVKPVTRLTGAGKLIK